MSPDVFVQSPFNSPFAKGDGGFNECPTFACIIHKNLTQSRQEHVIQ
jgi:hypothetical protein